MKRLLLFALSLTLSVPFIQAHEGHQHEAAVEAPPHGGMLRDAAPFKSEVVINGDVATLYIYDKALKPVKLDKDTLKGEVQFPRQKAKTVTFKRNGDNYKAKISGISKVHRFDLHVTLDVGGKKALADFGIDNIQ
jgi:hypothetical protein